MTVETIGPNMRLEICNIIDRVKALDFGAFRLASGKMSPYYINLRIVPSFPDVFQRICDFHERFIRNEIGADNFERIGGVPIAGMPFASVIALALRKPFLYVRRGERLHGRERRIEGVIAPGDRVLLVDDLVTTGLALERAAKAITAESGVVTDAVVLIDRQEGGGKRLEKSGVRLHALVTATEIAKTMRELGTIDEQQMKTILKQVKKK